MRCFRVALPERRVAGERGLTIERSDCSTIVKTAGQWSTLAPAGNFTSRSSRREPIDPGRFTFAGEVACVAKNR